MKSHIHTHIWEDSINETCPFCGRDTKYCTDAECYLYRCTNPLCRQVYQVKKEYDSESNRSK